MGSKTQRRIGGIEVKRSPTHQGFRSRIVRSKPCDIKEIKVFCEVDFIAAFLPDHLTQATTGHFAIDEESYASARSP
jgi:hypothetical protein